MIQLRPYQTDGLDAIWNYFQSGNTGNPVLAWPTGTGKSVVPAIFIESVMRLWPTQRFLMITHVKELIQQKIEKAEKDLMLIRESFINDQNNGTDDTSPTFKAFEEGAETLSKEQNAILAGRQEKFLRDLKNALIRIENKTYGICRVTGKLIGKERLRAVPHATLSIEAKNMQR